MLALMIVEVQQITEIIFCIVISVIGIVNMVIGAYLIKVNSDIEARKVVRNYIENVEF